MILEEDDLIQFRRLHDGLLSFVNRELKLFEIDSDILQVLHDEFEAKLELYKAFYENPTGYINDYLARNPDKLQSEEREIIESWKELRVGEFAVFRQLQKYAVVLGTGEDTSAYAVLGLTEPLGDVVDGALPIQITTALFPFRGVIVYDGLMSGDSYWFTGKGKRALNEQYKAAKAGRGLVGQLSSLGAPLRKLTAAERVEKLAGKLRESLGVVREQRSRLETFENDVLPSYKAWVSKSHRDEEKRIEELGAELEDLSLLLEEIEMSWHYREHPTKAKTVAAVEKEIRERGRNLDDGEQNPAKSGSPAEDIPDSMIDAMLEEFLREMRGTNLSKLSAKEKEKAREDFLKSLDYAAGGDKAAFESSMLKLGADDSEKNQNAVKKAYRRLAREVHPDRNSDFDEEAKEIWEELRVRRDALDLESLETLEMKWRLIRGVTFQGRDEKRLKRLREALREEEADLEYAIYEFSDHPMWGKRKTEVPPKAIQKRVARDLRDAIADLESEKVYLEKRIAEFRGSPKKKAPVKKKSPKKKLPKKKAPKKKRSAKAPSTAPPGKETQQTFDF